MCECCCEMSFSQPLVLPSLAGNAKLRSGQTTVCQKRPGASILSWCHLGCSQFEALSQNITRRFSANSWKKKKKKRHCSHVQSCVQLLGQQRADTTFFNGCFFSKFESNCQLVPTVWVPSVACQVVMLNNNKCLTVSFSIVVFVYLCSICHVWLLML